MGWYEAIKDAVSVADRLRDAELKQKIANVQVEYAKMAEENAHLRQELLEFREQKKVRQFMEFVDSVYWRASDGKREGPFCPKCLDGSERSSRMGDRHDDHCWRCAVCGLSIVKPGQ